MELVVEHKKLSTDFLDGFNPAMHQFCIAIFGYNMQHFTKRLQLGLDLENVERIILYTIKKITGEENPKPISTQQEIVEDMRFDGRKMMTHLILTQPNSHLKTILKTFVLCRILETAQYHSRSFEILLSVLRDLWEIYISHFTFFYNDYS